MYRPDGWEKILLAEVKKIPDPELLKGDMTKALLLFTEAGADAMLESLRAKGIKTNKFKTNSNPIYLTNPRQNGVYVFIPEEKSNLLIKMADIPERIEETNKEEENDKTRI